MDDLGWSWPYWKFGLKKDALFTTLHDQYNTFPSAIQDPEAFHHDVFEISSAASSDDEFYRLLDERKSQRLRELNESLTDASLEIISNPSLIGTAQWQHAVQLFRTKSLDSLVRYFASYLPESHPWHRDASGSVSDAESNVDSVTHSHHDSPSFFDDDADDKPVMLTHEPLPISTSISTQLPPSPRSMTMRSDESGACSPVDCDEEHEYINALTPPRTLSFSESEPDHLADMKFSAPSLPDDEEDLSQSDDADSPATSVSDLEEIEASQEKDVVISEVYDDEIIRHEYLNITKLRVDLMEAETPTPKPEPPSAPATSFFNTHPCSVRGRSLSPSRSHPHYSHAPYHHDCRRVQRSLRRRDYSPDVGRRRRSPVEPASRVHKALPDSSRLRSRGRRHVDER
ncbi:hypothetical protein NKR23_g9705 [Pleurostoma richardsiae]|uniref:Uncharacterized protein n=1 Tax=Pleurostoma richardsiae TaxID=41990 RepID=A0AA38VJQ1_9PEZI|nr:hypothetical protein NKR23_g9705 [Pleurostoma richardsiae]